MNPKSLAVSVVDPLIESARERIAAIDVSPKWSDEWPTEPGMYWFHGLRGWRTSTKETCPVQVRRGLSGFYAALIMNDGCVCYLTSDKGSVGKWLRIDRPQPPKEAANV